MTPSNLAVMPIPAKPKEKRKTRRRVRGQGTIFRRGRIYWFELAWNQQRFRESLKTPDRETAIRKMNARIASIHSGELPKAFEPVLVQSLYDTWISEVERTCKARTHQDYQSRWNGHLKPVFGKLVATQVTKDVVSKYLTARKREGAGPLTENRENRVLQMIFNYNRKKISANDFPEFPEMHSEKSHVRKGRLSQEDYNIIMARLNDEKRFWLRVIVAMTFKFGFRKGELLNAKVGYFNAKTSTFTLPAFTTKNKMEREVSIKRDGDIYQMLVKVTDGRDKNEALFTRNGKPVNDYRGAWKILTYGISNGRGGQVTIHDLRRSAITNMSNKGVGAAQAGTHLTADVFNRYISRSEDEKQATASLIES
jgi:integrase